MRKFFRSYDGRRVRLSDTQRLHILYFHPEALASNSRIRETVNEPEIIGRGATHDTRVHYRFFEGTPVTAKYLAVVIKQLDGEGFIVTAYFTPKVKRSRIVWRRTS